MFPEIGNRAIVKNLPRIDPEWRNAEVVIVGMDLRHDTSGHIDSMRSRILVSNSSNQRRDLPLGHLDASAIPPGR